MLFTIPNNLNRRSPGKILLLLLTTLLSSCQPNTQQLDQPAQTRQFTIVHINDVYRIAGVGEGRSGGIGRVRTLRRELEQQYGEVLLLHGGDFLFPSLLSREYQGEQMIDMMNRLDGQAGQFDPNMLVVFGNHEFDKPRLEQAKILTARLDESEFFWLDTNIDWLADSDGNPYVAHANSVSTQLLTIGDIKVGLFGLTTNVAVPAYATIDSHYSDVARRASRELRARGAEVVIAVTHLPVSEDTRVLQDLRDEGPDVIFGGHEHQRQQVNVSGRYVLKADSDARSAVVAQVKIGDNKELNINYKFRALGRRVEIDYKIETRVTHWQENFARRVCEKENLSAGCLDRVYGRANVALVGEEQEIRKYETNLGSYLADLALSAFQSRGAQIAFLNSGTLRINQDIPRGANITERHLREIFQYPTGLRLFRMTGADLQAAVDYSVKNWTGNGRWLQVAGFGFVHDPDTVTASNLSILDNGQWRRVNPNEEILAVSTDYLLDPVTGQDGYHMLDARRIVDTGPPYIRMIELARQAIGRAGEQGIAPQFEGRICNTTRPARPCAIE